MLKSRMLMNQMPVLGDLQASDAKNVKQRVRAIKELLDWKESKTTEMRQGFQEKIRKANQDRDIQEKKVDKLERRIVEMDKKNAALELKNKELE